LRVGLEAVSVDTVVALASDLASELTSAGSLALSLTARPVGIEALVEREASVGREGSVLSS
jgi:hypothetical protein